ncbi:MAG TPA: nuclear transport factor 2 family protein [Gemmatimonadaceae bacterium]|nr:nuclear transport factor 2 family protein [Gemmatimonadaceae bacterium]
MRSTQDVFDHHLACFAANDLEGILSDFTEQSVLMTPLGVLRGPAEIRSFFEAVLAEFGAPGTKFTPHQMLVEGDCAFAAWDAETSANRYEAASDTFVIRDGRIAVQTFSARVTPKRSA